MYNVHIRENANQTQKNDNSMYSEQESAHGNMMPENSKCSVHKSTKESKTVLNPKHIGERQ
jgi:hypothetical protein